MPFIGMVIGVSISLAAYGYFYTTSEPLKSPFAAHVVHHVHHVHKLQNKPHEEDHDDRDRWPYAPLEIDEKTKHDHAVRCELRSDFMFMNLVTERHRTF